MPYIKFSVAQKWRFNGFYSKWQTSAILDLLDVYWNTHDEYLVVSIVLQNLVGIDAVSFDNMKLSIFCPFDLKTFAIACFRPTAEATFRSC